MFTVDVTTLNIRLVATNLNSPRSGLKADVIKGLPNVGEYIYKNRKFLIEEQRLNNMINAELLNRFRNLTF